MAAEPGQGPMQVGLRRLARPVSRQRSRDRGNRGEDQIRAKARYRTRPAGPQELDDWIQACVELNDRLDSKEKYRSSRLKIDCRAGKCVLH